MTEVNIHRWRWKSTGKTGLIHAANKLLAIRRLSARGHNNISVKQERFCKTKKPSDKEWLQTLSQWLELLECGLPLPDALKHSVNEHSSKAITWLIDDCVETVQQGQRLSDALRNYPDWLSATDIQTIEWAESSGQLVRGLNNILTLKQQQMRMKEKLTKAFRYPLIIAAVACSVAILMMTWVLPQFQTLFGHTALPTLTQNVLSISTFIKDNALFIGVFFALLYFSCWLIQYKCPALWRRFTLKLPIFASFIVGAREQQIYYQLGLSLDAGIDAIHALQLTTNNLDCPVYKTRLAYICDSLENGLGWSRAFSLSELNCPKTMSFIQAAERSGRIAQAFKQLASYQQKQLDVYSERLSAYVQPLLMLVLGGIIGTLLVAMYLPLFSLGEQF